MSMSRKLKKKLIAAAAALTVFSAGAANVSAGDMLNGKVEFGGTVEIVGSGNTSLIGQGFDNMTLKANQNP